MTTNQRLPGAFTGALAASLFLVTLLVGPVASAQDAVPSPAQEAQAAETAPLAPPSAGARETNCSDGQDEDGDTVTDCGDADCAADPACQPDGQPENTSARCSDWVDNDSDGFLDCEDRDCEAAGVEACRGSWKGGDQSSQSNTTEVVPDLPAGGSVEDLIGKGSDKDGERNDELCADGIDNDADGRTDCADIGCRFDPTVSVCRGNPGLRFSVVTAVTASYDLDKEQADTRFSTLQLRAFGPMPAIQDSFFLLSMRVEKTPRLTFAMFQVPLGGGHYVNLNSGSGGLSSGLVTSASKRLLLEPAFYLYNAFEQGNGAALELGGPVLPRGRLNYRAFVAGGTGRFSGNVGGGFVSDDTRNYTWTAGGQLHLNIIGFWSRWDTPFLYTPASTTFAVAVGAKYDQRANERYPALNTQVVFRWRRLMALGENYTKRELEFGSWQTAYNLQLGYLLWPKHIMLAADFGEFLVGDMDNAPVELPSDVASEQETLWRVAAHYYLWRNIGVVSLLYSDRRVDGADGEEKVTRELNLIGQYRF